jgi:hypothetical protein
VATEKRVGWGGVGGGERRENHGRKNKRKKRHQRRCALMAILRLSIRKILMAFFCADIVQMNIADTKQFFSFSPRPAKRHFFLNFIIFAFVFASVRFVSFWFYVL